MCFHCASSGLPVTIQCVPIMQINTGLPLGYHWVVASAVWFQWHPCVLVAPVVFQCVPIMQINTGLPLEDHWATASSSVAPVQYVQWYPSVLRASDLEVIRSGHVPACNPSCIQLVWRELFGLSWFHFYCNQKYTKTIMVLISKACTDWCWSTHAFVEQNWWYALQSSKLRVKAEFTETCPLAGVPSSCHCPGTGLLILVWRCLFPYLL